MPHIEQLDSHVADLIAAGEVVERPASVVKELVENALDAGATAVAVELQNGGMRLIRVTDNGSGIPQAELPLAFLRHATSKLRSAEDLGKICTLGFRGEALAAISAVSRVEISSCRAGFTGAALRLEGGVPGEVIPAGVPVGTSIFVRDLFFNTPARLKFMKKDSAETAAVMGLMQHLALSHPEVTFKFVKDGAQALQTPGDGKLDAAVYAAMGREFAQSLTEAEGRGGEIALSGFITKPLCGRGSRGMQVFFVNGRFIKSQLLTAALEEGYRNQLMKGRFPGCVLRLELPATSVDVNVHPAKTTVKFARDREVFDAVYHTVMDALSADGAPTGETTKREDSMANMPKGETANGIPPKVAPPAPRQDFYQTMDAAAFRQRADLPGQKSVQTAVAPWISAGKSAAGWDTERRGFAHVADSGAKPLAYAPSHLVECPANGDFFPQAPPAGKSATECLPEERPAQRTAENAPAALPFVPAIPPQQTSVPLPGERSAATGREAPWRIAGEVLKTYIVCEDEAQNVWLIDKHAAHERLNFDRLLAASEPPMRQILLRPVAAELPQEDGELLLESLPLLESLGFTCEDFGDGAVLVREIPADLDAADTVATLEELADKLRTGRDGAEKREALLHTMACKAAIKAGWTTDETELRVLVDLVQSGELQYCPHGRPVKVKTTKYELEKMFKRA